MCLHKYLPHSDQYLVNASLATVEITGHCSFPPVFLAKQFKLCHLVRLIVFIVFQDLGISLRTTTFTSLLSTFPRA